MKIVQITTDSRVHFGEYGKSEPYFGTAPDALLQGFREISGEVEVHVISTSRQPMATPAKIAPNIYFHQPVVHSCGMGRSLFAGAVTAIRRVIRGIDPDIVHGQGTERECALAAVFSGYPNVLTIHGIMQEIQRLGFQGHALYGFIVSQLETLALKRTAGVFCNSSYTESLIAPRTQHTWLVPNPIRDAFFAPRGSVKTVNPITQILNVGLVSPRKRQLELLRTVGELVRKGHPMRLLFIGDLAAATDYGKAFIAELQRAEAAGYASHLGFLDAPELIELMDRSDGFIHFPSEEAFGLVVAEAIARGLKFFGSNLGGIRDIASGIGGAELHDDFDSLSKGLITWLDAGAPAPENAAKQIAERYHPRVIAERHLEIYREVLRTQS